MKFDGDQKSVKPHNRLGRTTDEAARSFARSLAERISVRIRGTIALAQRSSQSQRFSRQIARRRNDVGGADPLSFLSSQLGNKFASVQTRGLGGERIYRHPGQFFRNTTYNSVTELCMSFNFNQTVRNLQSLLSQIHTTQLFARTGKTWIENKTTSSSRAGRELPQVTKLSLVTRWSEVMKSSSVTEWSHAVQGLPPVHLQPAMYWSSWLRSPQVVRRFQVMQSPQSRFSPQSVQLPQSILLQPSVGSPHEFIVRLPASQVTNSGETGTHAAERLFTLTKLARRDTERTQVRERNLGRIQAMISSVTGQALVRTTYVRYLGDKSLQPHVDLDPRSLRSVTEVTITGERRLNIAARQSRSSDPSVSFTQRSAKEVRFAFEERRDLPALQQIKARPRSLDAGFAFIPQSVVRILTKQFETRLLATKVFETNRVKKPVPALAAGVSRNLQSASELVLVRKEGASRAPSMDFVFAQPARQKITEEQVVKKFEQREIVELVRKEVKQSMARVSPLAEFTRTDFVEISDYVYSILVKRLTAERERLGLR